MSKRPDARDEWPGALQLREPVWVCDEQQRVVLVNRGLERLLGLPAERCESRPCHELIGGLDAAGNACCRRDCPLFARAMRGEELEPLTLQIRRPGDRNRWIRVLPFVARRPDGTRRLIHCAQEADAELRARNFIEALAARCRPLAAVEHGHAAEALTCREREVLDLLAGGLDSKAAARRLHVSYVTVRNHVQNLLPKLGAHSILEAVARHLLRIDARASGEAR